MMNNCHFVNNTALTDYGAIYFISVDNLIFNNTSFTNNKAINLVPAFGFSGSL